jgi:hypothetical protein
MSRNLAWWLVVWGVAVWAIFGYQLLFGLTTIDKIVTPGIVGGLLVALGYWMKSKTRRKPPDQQGGPMAPSNPGEANAKQDHNIK